MKRTAIFFLLILANVSVGCVLWYKWDREQLLLTSTRMNPHVSFLKFEDLNGDGTTDEIHIIDYNNIYSVFGIRFETGFVSDIKVAGKIKSSRAIYFHDIDMDGKKEIWSIMRYQDTLRLNLADHLAIRESCPIIPVDPDFSLEFQDYFVEIIGYHEGLLFFAINSGYPLKPRAIYSFNSTTKELNRSKDEGSLLLNPFLFDLNDDGKPEIIPRSFAPENIHYDVPYTDSSAWLRVFDLDLNHVFEPIEYKHNTSTIEVFPYEADSANYLCVSHRYGGQRNVMHSVSLVDKNGKIVIKNKSENRRSLFEYDKQLYISDYTEPAIYQVNENLQTSAKVIDLDEAFVPRVSKKFPITSKNALLISYSNDKLFVLSKNLSSIASYYFPDGIQDVAPKDMKIIHVRSGGKEYILKYAKEFNVAGWGVFAGVVLLQFVCAFIIQTKKEKLNSNTNSNQNTQASSSKTNSDRIELKSGKVLDIKSITYISSNRRYRVYHMAVGEETFREKLTIEETLQKLPSSMFIQISRSTIVNKNHIISKSSDGLLVTNRKQPLSISRSFRDALRDLF